MTQKTVFTLAGDPKKIDDLVEKLISMVPENGEVRLERVSSRIVPFGIEVGDPVRIPGEEGTYKVEAIRYEKGEFQYQVLGKWFSLDRRHDI